MAASALIDSIADRLADQLVNSAGEHASHDYVAGVVAAAADSLVNAPLQQFVPLLVENEARNKLHHEGMHVASA
jgi:hypothetical protein